MPVSKTVATVREEGGAQLVFLCRSVLYRLAGKKYAGANPPFRFSDTDRHGTLVLRIQTKEEGHPWRSRSFHFPVSAVR